MKGLPRFPQRSVTNASLSTHTSHIGIHASTPTTMGVPVSTVSMSTVSMPVSSMRVAVTSVAVLAVGVAVVGVAVVMR